MSNTPADASTTPASTPLLFDRYRVREQLGEVRLASVYAATDERLQRHVLFHIMRKDLAQQETLRARFVEEISERARLSHPALLEVFDSGEASQRPFMITEYVVGRPISTLGVLSLEQALLYIRQVAGAVAVCQAQRSPAQSVGLAHPPISSSNVLVVDEGQVKFVESWLIPLDDITYDLAHYRPPELTSGSPPSTASAVYSLAILLHEMLTGVRPIRGATAADVAQAHLSTRVAPLAQDRPTLFLPLLEDTLARATSRLPEQRPADAETFGRGLETVWRELSGPTRRLDVAPAVAPQRPRRNAPAAVPPPQPPQREPQPIRYPDPAPDSVATQPRSAARRPAARLRQTLAQPLRRASWRQGNRQQAIVGWVVMLGLIAVVAWGSFVGVNYLIDRVPTRVAVPETPSVATPAPSGFGNPIEWLSGLFNRGDVLVVNTEFGLNMRDAPGLNTNVVAEVPNNTRVRRLEGPVVQDDVSWVRVEARIDGETKQGWMSLNYLKPEE